MSKIILDNITLLNQVTLDSLKDRKESHIVKRYTEVGLKILNADFGFVWLKNKSIGENGYYLAYKSKSTPFSPTYPRKHGTINRALRMKTPIYFEDISKASHVMPFARKFLKGLAIVPILYKNRVYGSILLCFKNKRNFIRGDKSLCSALGAQLAQTFTISQLHLNLEDLKNTLDQTMDSVVIFNPDNFKIEYANKGFALLFKVSGVSFHKDNFLSLIPVDMRSAFETYVDSFKKGKYESATFEIDTRSIDGNIDAVEVFAQLISFGDKRKCLVIMHDITKRKKDERRIHDLLKQKDEFLGMASHELKTPITTIKGFTQLLQKRLEHESDGNEGSKETIYFLNKVNSQVDKLTNLITELLDVSRIESGRIEFKKDLINLSELIHEIVENLQMTIESHRILVNGRIDGWIEGDKDRLLQVFSNIVLNAVKYSPDVDKIAIKLEHDRESVTIGVQDFGHGIPKKIQKKVFERFYQGSGGGTAAASGLGLGLYISSEIVKRHSGRIWCKSRIGKGTTFFVRFPKKGNWFSPVSRNKSAGETGQEIRTAKNPDNLLF